MYVPGVALNSNFKTNLSATLSQFQSGAYYASLMGQVSSSFRKKACFYFCQNLHRFWQLWWFFANKNIFEKYVCAFFQFTKSLTKYTLNSKKTLRYTQLNKCQVLTQTFKTILSRCCLDGLPVSVAHLNTLTIFFCLQWARLNDFFLSFLAFQPAKQAAERQSKRGRAVSTFCSARVNLFWLWRLWTELNVLPPLTVLTLNRN